MNILSDTTVTIKNIQNAKTFTEKFNLTYLKIAREENWEDYKIFMGHKNQLKFIDLIWILIETIKKYKTVGGMWILNIW